MSSLKSRLLFFLASILQTNVITNGATSCREKKKESERMRQTRKRRECNAGFFLVAVDGVAFFSLTYNTNTR